MKNIKKVVQKIFIQKKYYFFITHMFFALIFFTMFYDIGLNSKYFIKKDFSKAFLFRQTGNCEEFMKYINNNWVFWSIKCNEEKRGDVSNINEFNIKNITITGGRAFLQVELKRDLVDEKDLEYTANYEMRRIRGHWLIDQETQ